MCAVEAARQADGEEGRDKGFEQKSASVRERDIFHYCYFRCAVTVIFIELVSKW